MDSQQYQWGDQIKMGSITLNNRICMAALTRQRCNPQNGIPNDLMIQYYSQRTGASMILTQAASWSQRGQCFPGAPSLYTNQHAQGWKKVVEAVHKKGGKLFLQIFHGGRACLVKTTGGLQTWGPSSIAIRDKHRRLGIDHDIPKSMSLQDIQTTKTQFRKSIKLAKQCNFDGIQLHGAHGYLVDSFLRSQSNKRIDQYGGSAQKRCRFALQLIEIILQYFKPQSVGIKISPVSRLNDMYDIDPIETYSYLLKQLSLKKIGFVQIRQSHQVNMSKQQFPKTSQQQMNDICKILRPFFNGIIIANQSYNQKTGIQKIKSGNAQMISFGRLYISNPDLAQRLIKGNQINKNWDVKTFFGTQHGSNGYTDYPFYQCKNQKNQ